MDNFIYSLNATVPVFVVIVAGYTLKKIGWINEGFIKAANKLTFSLTLPLLLIQDMMSNDFIAHFQLKYVLFCFLVTLLCCVGTTVVAMLVMKDKNILAEFVQASYRSSAAVLGAAFILNIYGSTGMLPLMIVGAVPFYNVYAVIILTVFCPEKGATQEKTLAKTLKGIATNPIIIGIVVGVILSALKVDFPIMIDNTINNFAKNTTPLALLAIGGSFEIGKALKKIKPAVIATTLKLIGWPIIFLPLAVMLGFRNSELLAIVIMLGSPTTPSCYVMVKSMKSEGTLTSSVIVLTTMFSAFSITAIIFVLRTMGYL
ncbi:MAG: AEC family transporter [Eubacterium sp.]|nr:AEC family transporter [Eubacterium sp.]